MYTNCILKPYPPRCYLLLLRDCQIIVNPNNTEIIEEITSNTNKPITTIILNENLSSLAPRIYQYTHLIIPHSLCKSDDIPTYPLEQEIPITRNTSIYLIYPPTIENKRNYYSLIQTKTLNILISTRLTHIETPPIVDILLTYEEVYNNAQKYIKNKLELPKYLGSDAYWCFILGKKDKTDDKYIHIRNKEYIIQRHLSEITVIENK